MPDVVKMFQFGLGLDDDNMINNGNNIIISIIVRISYNGGCPANRHHVTGSSKNNINNTCTHVYRYMFIYVCMYRCI
jgi:hypothetical protein